MKDMMQYNVYFGSVHYSDDDAIFHGKLEFIRALVSYEGRSVKELRKAFEEAVDDYLSYCREQAIEPEQPFKGSFNVRIGRDLHRRAAIAAKNEGVSLNSYIARALQRATEQV